MLADDQLAVCSRFASRGEDKFAGLEHAISDHGVPVLAGTVGTIACEIESVAEAGGHFIVIGRVLALDSDHDRMPLMFFQGGYGTFTGHAPG